ncbi:oxidoreductase FAD/NAD(P)-binding domain protein [Ancylobacter novellus DSM 506]|uniref:NADPH--hemoprotein reductase n=1 Tax=Ancylobacter novellus (strain ATCC 8093 / DSM 506 / JCM 20403 / CCM 1077 / IAM 12100 / NBRC 12443 / NCIMB 10456) TaxID=639283 RepID=D7A7N8_ANCN5|nr:PepSY domain-containing protein [Ancylobacter novellus]ADH88486.1 oxidoreductase FAD/NAD(P)-binding domain protein [Ancylobacter novellus DSM 506]
MIRALHRWPGLLALALVTLLAVSGAALSVFPAAERIAAPQAAEAMSVADLATRIRSAHPGVEQIRRSPSGRITAFWFDGGTPGSAVIDPATGADVASADPNAFQRWLTNLHRSLFLDDAGRIVMAAGAAAMLVLAVSGCVLVARRAGGWRRWFARLRGPLAGRVHVELARAAVLGLLMSSATALWMTASTFGFLPDEGAPPEPPSAVSGRAGAPLASMPLLAATPVSSLRELSFPYPDDATDVFTLRTDEGAGYIDQGTGATLAWVGLSGWERVSETVYMLHTGQGAPLLGLLLGLTALAVPAMGITGLSIWLAGRARRPGIRDNAAPGRAETIILVGSEGGSSWGFAATLHAALTRVGQHVHTTPMSAFDPAHFSGAQRYLVLAATYGDGNAPASAKGFLDRLAGLSTVPEAPVAVLGFGDRSFPAFCAYAKSVVAAAEAKGWRLLLPFETVDRQSPQEFARWGHALGEALGIALELDHQPIRPETSALTLVSRRDYGHDVQAPTAILRFALPRLSMWQRLTGQGFARFEAGDLIGIVPEGSPIPRFYSLASGRRDGFVEIVVRRHVGGLCSSALTTLEPGGTVAAFIRRNPGFHAARDRTPLILIGAGTGVGPLAGFIRANGSRRPIHLFFGMRHPDSDFLYREELEDWAAGGRLRHLSTAISRGARPRYVQDALIAEQLEVVRAIRDGAHVMVCGGRQMAAGVAEAMTRMLEPLGLSHQLLKAEGRYVEDVY